MATASNPQSLETPATVPQKQWLIGGAIYLVAFAVMNLGLNRGDQLLIAFSNLTQLAGIGLVVLVSIWGGSTATQEMRRFWYLSFLGGLLWFVVQAGWTYYEVLRHVPVPDFFYGDIALFLHLVPTMAALAVQPHLAKQAKEERQQLVDFMLITVWWLYLYVFTLLPWQFVHPDERLYSTGFNVLYMAEHAVLLFGLARLSYQAPPVWSDLYRRLFIAEFVYAMASLATNVSIDLPADAQFAYYTGSWYDLFLTASSTLWAYCLFWTVWNRGRLAAATAPAESSSYRWTGRFSRLAALSMPVLALWVALFPSASVEVDRFRLLITVAALVPLLGLVFYKQVLLNQDLQMSLTAARRSYDDLRRLQAEVLQTEKLASLGRLISGAAHEINNPLTAIVGYADLLGHDNRLEAQDQGNVERILSQARRTKSLVNNLIAFAKQGPLQRTVVDVNAVSHRAVELFRLGAETQTVDVRSELASNLPAIQADANQLLQVFVHILNNAGESIAAHGGAGVITITTAVDHDKVVWACADTGSKVENPSQIFDPFHAPQELGKGIGLGLSASYGIIREHGGSIACENRPGGGALFTISLPVTGQAVTNPTT